MRGDGGEFEVEAVGPEAIGEFLDLAWALQGGDPRWIPPLRAIQERDLLGRGEFGRYASVQPFLCRGPSGLVGRVAAVLNPRLVDDGGLPVGQVGWYESIDDLAVASSLLEAAGSWLEARGARRIWGPSEGGAHRLHRFRFAGDERDPFLLEPQNPPWYPRLFDALGFRPRHTWQTYVLPAGRFAEALEAERLTRVARARASRHFRIDFPDPRDPASLARIHPLLDDAWRVHVGYAPFDLAEAAEAFGGLLALFDPGHLGVVVSRRDGRDVGFGFVYPDYASEVRALSGDASGWASWVGKPDRPRGLVLHTMAILPEARRMGAPILLYDVAVRLLAEGGYEECILGLVTRDLKFYSRFATPAREYALYERSLPLR